jgi:catechol 2,3-dioxygenase-like lactoylglutathione lyase family enzyme
VSLSLFAGLRVRDLATARPWYEQLLGDPSFFPNDREVVWMLADERAVYIEQDPGRAGDGLVTVIVDDLDSLIAEIEQRGLQPADIESYANGVRKAIYRDADGNEIGFGGLPATT